MSFYDNYENNFKAFVFFMNVMIFFLAHFHTMVVLKKPTVNLTKIPLGKKIVAILK
jgi:hypothetical protein